MRRIAIVPIGVFFFLSLAGICLAQQPTAPDATKVQQFIAQQFGPDYKLVPGDKPLVLDLNRDGKQDLVVVANGPNPFEDQAKYHYKVADPYDEYFGYGNPKVTIQFDGFDHAKRRYLLIAHDWQGTPAQKFVLINVPEFSELKVGRFLLKKKTIEGIMGAEGYGGVEWAIYWNGKRYQWEAYGLTPETKGKSPDKAPW